MNGLLAGEVKEFPLLSMENTPDFMGLDSITTATIYNGRPPIDSLKSRVNAIAELNPWLVGRLLKKNKKVFLQYPSGTVPDADFVVLDDLNFTASTYNPVQHNSDFERHLVGKGTECLNKDKPLFRVIVAVLNPNQFVLFVSMCHAVADGSTYYSMYNMLSATAAPRALIMERDEACSLVVRSIAREEVSFFRSGGFIMNVVGKLLFHGKHHMSYFRVRPEWIESQKEQYQQRKGAAETTDAVCSSDDISLKLHEGSGSGVLPPLSFISSNDIITCAVFRAVKADIGVIPVNFRNRCEGLTSDHCGAYAYMSCIVVFALVVFIGYYVLEGTSVSMLNLHPSYYLYVCMSSSMMYIII